MKERLAKIRSRLRLARRLPKNRRGALAGVLTLLAVSAGAALGCGWDGFERSVRFNFSTGERERERLPPLPYRLRGGRAGAKEGAEAGVDEGEALVTGALWTRAEEAAAGGDLWRVRVLLRQYVGRGGEHSNSAVDRLDALSALDAGSNPAGVRAYLDARAAYDEWLAGVRAGPDAAADGDAATQGQSAGEAGRMSAEGGRQGAADGGRAVTAEGVRAALGRVGGDAHLADNVAYLLAAVLYREGRADEAARAFERVAARRPRGEKREAALFMAARARMSASRAYLGEGATATSEGPCPDCRDDAWRSARDLFARLVREYPRGRLTNDARGWLAYLRLRAGDTGGALAEYYRMLADAGDSAANEEALRSLRLARGRADGADLERLEAELAGEPEAALAYAYHEIYNYTFSYYFDSPELAASQADSASGCYPDRWRDGAARRVCGSAERQNLARVARFAARMVERSGGAGAGGAFVVRAAQANLETGEDEAALALARRALRGGVAGAERAGALWVEAVAEYRLGDLAASRASLARLVAEFSGGDVEGRARRLLAMAAEEAGDLDSALEQYLALGYDADASYFVEVLLTPEQLAAFVGRRPEHPRRDELLYALGVRHLRAGRYAEARAALLKVKTTRADAPDDSDEWRTDFSEPDDPKYRIRHFFYDEDAFTPGGGAAGRRGSRVYADWVLRDLKTAEDLERLEGAVAQAAGDEAKAEAAYQLASYLYEGSGLKFYNPAAWRGMRAEMMASLDESRYRSPGEAGAVLRHAREHEPVARALELYLDIVRRYPRTRAAPDALYTAILCHQRLAEYNAYWRGVYAAGLHAGERVVTLGDLRRAYPLYRLPRAGVWRPSARTVNGGPARPALQKPKPLTWGEGARRKIRRAEALVARGWALFGEVAGGRARRWSLVLFFSACAFAVLRATHRSRARLIALVARPARVRRRPRDVLSLARRSTYGTQERYTPGGRARAWAAVARAAFRRAALDGRVRAALALNLLTHGLLTALLYAAAWALRAG